MVYIDNTQTKKEMEDAVRGNSVTNIAPTKVNDFIQPVININPKDYRRVNIVRSRATAGAIYTTPVDKDFFLTSSFLSVAKVAADTGTDASVTCTIDGASQTLTTVSGVTLTLNFANLAREFNPPIKIDRNTAITSVAGNITRCGSGICGYTVEP